MKERRPGADIKLTMKPKNIIITRTTQDYESRILSESRYYQFLQLTDMNPSVIRSAVINSANGYDKKLIKKELERVRATLTQNACSITFYIANKIMCHLIEGLYVHQ